MNEPDEGDPNRTVWEAVADLERKAYTKREIYDALRAVADDIRPEDA